VSKLKCSHVFTVNDIRRRPDLFDVTPDGKYFMVAFRGPVPVSVAHASQGSCPGVGIVEITEGGRSGRLVDVLRSSNTIDDYTPGGIPGGHLYTGIERSDVHGAIVVSRHEDAVVVPSDPSATANIPLSAAWSSIVSILIITMLV